MQFGTDSRGPQRMKLNDFVDLLAFQLVPSKGQAIHLSCSQDTALPAWLEPSFSFFLSELLRLTVALRVTDAQHHAALFCFFTCYLWILRRDFVPEEIV